jgi:hypothetical protein
MTSFAHLDDDSLLRSLLAAVGAHRNATAAIVAHLAEVEERRLHLRRAFSSMFQYCVTELAFSEDEACRRIDAARLSRRFPRILTMLEAGTLSLSVIGLLKEHLAAENVAELLDSVAGASVRRAKEWLAARFPSPDVPEMIRKLPGERARRIDAPAGPQALPRVAATETPAPQDQAQDRGGFLEASASPAAALPSEASPPASAQPQTHSRSSLEPLSRDRFALRVTISRATRDKLELARKLLRHAHPGGNLETILDEAVDALLERVEKAKLRKTKRPRRTTKVPRDARIGSGTRREVAERDGLRCSFVDSDGHRCDEQAFLEYDHVRPAGLGGGPEAANVRILCRGHNRLAAEDAYGRDFVEGAIAKSRERRARPGRARDSRG